MSEERERCGKLTRDGAVCKQYTPCRWHSEDAEAEAQDIKERLIEALEDNLGIVTDACRQCGVGRSMYYRLVNSDKEFAEQVKDIAEVAVDFVESKFFKLIRSGGRGAAAAMIFYLKTKAKHRGYVERRELAGVADQPLFPPAMEEAFEQAYSDADALDAEVID